VLTAVKDLLDTAQADRYNLHVQPGRDEAHTGLKRVDP
jgi:hypothetical protein